jgi:hypothetical protein
MIEPNFLPLFICRLRFLEIYIDLEFDFDILSYLMGSLCFSLTSPATLEHLNFHIGFRVISVIDFTFYENLRDAVAWNHLDSIINHPGGSQLQRVDIDIKFTLHYEDDGADVDENKVLNALRDGLPLLCTKDILFVRVVVEERSPESPDSESLHSADPGDP